MTFLSQARSQLVTTIFVGARQPNPMASVSDDTLSSVLDYSQLAIVGCSATPGKAAHEVPAYLQRHGYTIHPVNPFADAVLGEPTVDSLTEIDPATQIDVVTVFRPSDEVAGIVDDVLARRDSVGDVEALWLQLGIHDDNAVKRAEAAGLTVIEDRCMMVEHGRLRK